MVLIIKQWYERLGNNLNQLRNCIYVALFYKHNIKIPPHSFLNSTFVEIFDEGEAVKEEKWSDESCCFFYREKILGITQDCFKVNHGKVIHWLRNLFLLDYKTLKPLPNSTVVFHIRSGDIFKSNFHPKYVVPPVSFYTKVMNTNPHFKEIIILCEDMENPTINFLRKLYPKAICKLRPLIEDIKILLSAQNVVMSFGSFIPNLCVLSGHTKHLYATCYCSRLFDIKEVPFQLHIINAKSFYQKMGDWKNSPEQRRLLLTFKI